MGWHKAYFQHPDDVNQAYFPKHVVILGISVAAISILMLPADVANRQACRHAIYNGACSLTFPMKQLWLGVYIADAILVFFVIPFAMFYYEGDQDKGFWTRLKIALLLVIASANVCGLVLGILYGLVGKVDFTVRHLSSSAETFTSSWTGFSSSQSCIGTSQLVIFFVIQFCATAFAYYSQATAAQEIFGHTLQSLRGIKYLYLRSHEVYNVFQFGFVALTLLTLFYYAAFVWRKRKPRRRFQFDN